MNRMESMAIFVGLLGVFVAILGGGDCLSAAILVVAIVLLFAAAEERGRQKK